MAEVLDTLTTRFEADIQKFEASMKKMVSAAKGANDNIKKETEKTEGIFGNVGEAIEKTFSRARFATLEEGGAKIGIFGQALEALGPAGLVAAAGIAAVGEALNIAKEAAEYAETLEKAAAKLGVTTTALQEFDFMAVKAGTTTEALRQSLMTGEEAFGAFMTGIGDGKVKKAFDEIGITPEQAKSYGSLEAALPAIAEGIKNLGNTAAQAKVAKALGLEEMLPVLRQGSEGIRDTAEEAHKLGLVMDEDMIKKGAEAAEQMKIASKAIDVNMKEAFMGLVPVIVAVMNKIAEFARFTHQIIDAFQPTEKQSTDTLLKRKGMLEHEINGPWWQHPFGSAGKKAELNNVNNNLADRSWDSFNSDYDNEEAQKAAAKGLKFEGKAPKEKKGPVDDTAEKTKEANSALDQGWKAYDAAQAALTDNIQERADYQKKALDDELAKYQVENAAQADKLMSDKGISAATKLELNAKLIQARILQEQATEAKKAEIDKKAAQAADDQAFADQQKIAGYQNTILAASESMATSNDGRAKIALELLRYEQREAYQAEDRALSKRVEAGTLTEEGRDEQLANMRNSQRATYAQTYNAQQRNDPLYAASHPTTSFSDDFKGIEAKDLEAIPNALIEIQNHSKSAGAALHDMVIGFIQDLEQLLIKRELLMPLENFLFSAQGGGLKNPSEGTAIDEGSILRLGGGDGGGTSVLGDLSAGSNFLSAFSHLPGFAEGTMSSPSGWAMVGEKGRELVRLPGGSQVIPNDQVGDYMGGGGGGSPTFHYAPTVVVSTPGAITPSWIEASVRNGMQEAELRARAGMREELYNNARGNFVRR